MRYQDYVIKDGKFIGEFEKMYQKFTDPWHQSEKLYFSSLSRRSVCWFIEKYDIKSLVECGCGLGRTNFYIKENTAKNIDILGIDIPVEFQGYSIFSSKIKSREYVLLEHTHRGPNDINNKPYYIAARSSDGYKLIWKEYIYEYDPTKYQYEMYDLKKDPYEQNNIYFDASFQDKRLEMEYVIKERFSLINKMRKKE